MPSAYDHPALDVIADEMRLQGAAYPNAGAASLINALTKAGWAITNTEPQEVQQSGT